MNEIRISDVNQSEETKGSERWMILSSWSSSSCELDSRLQVSDRKEVMFWFRYWSGRQTHQLSLCFSSVTASCWAVRSTATDLWWRFDEDVSRWLVSLNRWAGSDDWTSWQLVKLQLSSHRLKLNLTDCSTLNTHHISWVCYWSDGASITTFHSVILHQLTN